MKNKKVLIPLLILGFLAIYVVGQFAPLAQNLPLGELIFGFLSSDSPVPSINEVVMPPNTTIQAATAAGTITIKSGRGLKSSYLWDGMMRSTNMDPRFERWYGSLGIYNPMGFLVHNPEEGQQKFTTDEEAQDWLSNLGSECVYNDMGLVVCFSRSGQDRSIRVEVWQILIGGTILSPYQDAQPDDPYVKFKKRVYYSDGKKPSILRGSSNSAITTSW